jgi:hypothetical protein
MRTKSSTSSRPAKPDQSAARETYIAVVGIGLQFLLEGGILEQREIEALSFQSRLALCDLLEEGQHLHDEEEPEHNKENGHADGELQQWRSLGWQQVRLSRRLPRRGRWLHR